MKTIKPKALKRGDVIGLVAPSSSPLSQERIDKGAEYFERLGYPVKLGKNIRAVRGFLAGTDEQRAADINGMFADKFVKAIVAVRGGYGTPRILPLIDYPLARRNPKIVVGYSDLTALQIALYKKKPPCHFFRTDGRSRDVQGDRLLHRRTFLEDGNVHQETRNHSQPGRQTI
jgi:muramoyltetrapeptide carboxypeptidase